MPQNVSRAIGLSSCHSVMSGTTPDTTVKTAMKMPMAMTNWDGLKRFGVESGAGSDACVLMTCQTLVRPPTNPHVDSGHNGSVKTSTLTWCIRVGMVLVVAAAIFSWIAVGRLGEVSKVGLEQTDVALGDAVALADATATIAGAIQDSLVAVADGMGAAAESIGHTVEVAEGVRAIINIGSFFGRIEDLADSLANTEVSMQE